MCYTDRPSYQSGFNDGKEDVTPKNPYEMGTEDYYSYKDGYKDGQVTANYELGKSFVETAEDI